MANLKVFISSTCYDLGVVRSKLQEFLRSLGHDPVLSEYSDVLYNPNEHTHTSCIKEVINCDAVILMIGSRFGGKSVPEAADSVDFKRLKTLSTSTTNLDDKGSISVTQLEVLKALDANVPVFAFVEERVLHDHLVYEKNKDKDILSKITFPSIDRADSARYIFEFINFLRLRNAGNSVVAFSRIEDIEFHLRKQWSALMQRLLSEQRTRANESERARSIQIQLDELKTAILSTIQAPEAREVARGVIRFRTLIDFISLFKAQDLRPLVLGPELTWAALVETAKIKRFLRLVQSQNRFSTRPLSTLIERLDGTIEGSNFRSSNIKTISEDIPAFSTLSKDVREAIWDAWTETTTGHSLILKQLSPSIEHFRKTLLRPYRLELINADLHGNLEVIELEPTASAEPPDPDFDFGNLPGDDDIPF